MDVRKLQVSAAKDQMRERDAQGGQSARRCFPEGPLHLHTARPPRTHPPLAREGLARERVGGAWLVYVTPKYPAETRPHRSLAVRFKGLVRFQYSA